MSTNALVQIGQDPNTALAAGGLGFDGFELRPSNMILVQPTTQLEGAVAGKFYITDSGDHYDELSIVILSIQKQRVLFPPGSELGVEPICRSFDGKVPADSAVQPQAASCAGCEHSSWAKFKETGKPPACKEKFRILFVDTVTQLPYKMTIGGSSIKPFSMAMNRIMSLGKLAQAKGQNPNLFDFTMTMKPLAQRNSKGKYYVLGLSDIKLITEEERAAFGELFLQFVLRRNEVEAAMQAEDDVDQTINAPKEASQDGPVEGVIV